MISNFLYRFGQNIIFILIGIIIMPIFYKALGPENLGLVSYVDSIASILSIIAAYGIARYGTREINKNRSCSVHNRLVIKKLRRANLITHLIANIIYCCVFFTFDFHENQMIKIIFIISLLSLNRNFFNVDWYYESHDKFKFLSVKNVIIKVALILLLYFLYLRKNDITIEYYLLTASYTFISFFVTYLYFISKYEKNANTKENNVTLKDTFLTIKSLTPTVLLSNSYLLYLQLDKIFLGSNNTIENGYYTLGERIALLIFQLVMTLIVVSLPSISKVYYENKDEYIKKVESLISVALILLLPVSIGIWLISPSLVYYFGGQEYLEAISVVKVFAVLILVLGIWRIVANHIFFVTGNEKSSFVIIIFGGIINLIIKYFNPQLSAYQSIVVTTSLHVTTLLIMFLYYWFVIKVKVVLFKLSHVKYFISASSFVFVDYFIDLLGERAELSSMIIMITLCPIVYFFMLFFVFKDKMFISFINDKVFNKC